MANGIVYSPDFSEQQVRMYRATDGEFLGNLFASPLRGLTGRIEIADGKLFASQTSLTTFGSSLNQYNLLTGEFELTIQSDIDNFAVAQTFSPVPEPATITALAIGGFALIRRRRNA